MTGPTAQSREKKFNPRIETFPTTGRFVPYTTGFGFANVAPLLLKTL